ncbi:MAG: cytochrome c biogenesis protein ResB, partial [Microcystis sp. M53600_WE12]|nr:cytochrome c biogenesis protein ResB [Microcystis sp. M53600_WE12]
MTISETSSNLKNTPPQWGRKFIQTIADLRLAIILLLLIAIFSISGTVIEQGQSLSFYQANYPEKP